MTTPPAPIAPLRASNDSAHESVACTTVRVPMPDGVELVGDLYIPPGAGPWPAVLTRTPYEAADLHERGHMYAAHGYLFLVVDVRGRYRSPGQWDPMIHETVDGPATIAWLAAHPSCDGRVATRGASYSGANQLMAAPHAPSALKAMSVRSAPADAFENVPFQGGAYELSDLDWAWENSGRTSLYDPLEAEMDDASRAASARAALTARPLIDADLRLGVRSELLRTWMQHWKLDKYWERRAWLPALTAARVPALHVSGWWDNNARGSVLAFQAMGGAAGGQRLLIGPWDHSMIAPQVTDLPEHEQALVLRAAWRKPATDELAWFEHHLKGQPNRLAPVEVFVTGDWNWHEWPDWPLPAETQDWHLGADGSIAQKRAKRGERSYDFDPARPNTISSATTFPIEPFPYNTALDERDDVLVYRSTPLDDELFVAGDVSAAIVGSSTALDCDWVVRLVDEYPDGRAICVRDGILRSRFRRGFARPRLLTPGRKETFNVNLWHIAHRFRAGHRLRVEIASSALGRWDVNLQDGGDLATATTPVVSRQTVHSGPRGSHLRLPVAAGAALAWER
ncbi:MAG: CocE/NonD family hydrolase [Planctomycetes bacterium]|nr:CocE/NonD family hydrolase [Planctomycetota bacterium]